MLKKSLWGIALCTVASLALLLTPGTSDAQRRGGWGGGRGNWSGNRGWNGNWNNNWNRDGRGWGWGGFGTGLAVGYGLGNWGGWGGYGGYGYSYPSYSGYYSQPYYYNSDSAYSTPNYDQSIYSQPQMGYYGAANVQQQTNPNAVDLTVFVPDPNAQIFFENHQTQQRGTVRHFQSNVTPGQTYSFNIRAQFTQNGQPVDQTRTIQAQAGQRVNVSFGNANQTQGAEGLQMQNSGGVYGNQYYGEQGTDNRQLENRQFENRQLDNRQFENRQFDNRQPGNQPGVIDNHQGAQGQIQGNLNNQGRTNTPATPTNPTVNPGTNPNPGAANSRGAVNNTQGSGVNNNQAPNPGSNQGTNAPPR